MVSMRRCKTMKKKKETCNNAQSVKINKKMVILTSMLLLSAIGTVSYALSRQDGGDMRVTDAPGFSGYSSMVTEADGDTHIVWHDNRQPGVCPYCLAG